MPAPPPHVGAPERPTRRSERARRLLASQAVREAIVSLAGLIGRPVRNQAGDEIGGLHDVVARWDDGQTYPPVTGLVVRVGRRLAFVDVTAISSIEHAQVTLRSARLDLNDFSRRPGEVMLSHDVLDHQLVDVDGRQVIRAADLYLAEALGRVRLVGVDVSTATLLRRLGPRRFRPRPTPDRVLDWAGIQPFGDSTQGAPEVRLRSSNDGLKRLRPGELADMLEELRRPERQRFLATLDPDEAADALEEMEPEELSYLLRDAEPDQAAAWLSTMEPDEAADALRDLDKDERDGLLRLMAPMEAQGLLELLDYPEDVVGGFMTTHLLTATSRETVAEITDRLAVASVRHEDLDAVAVVDAKGHFIGDVPVLDLLLALRTEPATSMGSLIDDEDPVTVGPDVDADEAVELLIEARRLSLVVVEDGRPIGRILADDLLDAIVPSKGRFHFPRLLS